MKSAANTRKLLSGMVASRGGVRVYGVGAAKTGTHSVGEMFANRVRSAHEQDCARLIALHLDSLDHGDRRALRRFLRWRDLTRKLKIDASQVNIYLIDDLLELWPDSRFVLTVRPPMVWLRSIVDDSLRRDTGEIWKRFRTYRFDSPEPLPPEEKALSDRGLFSLSGYLGYWADSITRVTDRVPAEQVLVLTTDSLHDRSAEIATFCGIPGGGVPAERSHAFANDQRFGVLQQVPEDHLFRVAEKICGPVLKAHFPGRRLEEDVLSIRAA